MAKVVHIRVKRFATALLSVGLQQFQSSVVCECRRFGGGFLQALSEDLKRFPEEASNTATQQHQIRGTVNRS